MDKNLADELAADTTLNDAVVEITEAAIMCLDADEDNSVQHAAFERAILPVLTALRGVDYAGVIESIPTGENQWNLIVKSAGATCVCVPVSEFVNAAADWRWVLGVLPQTERVAERAESLEVLFNPPSDVADILAAIRAQSALPALAGDGSLTIPERN